MKFYISRTTKIGLVCPFSIIKASIGLNEPIKRYFASLFYYVLNKQWSNKNSYFKSLFLYDM
ncbi:hypothetical protein AO843_02335 [Lysinibacillus sp. ZYM-1]|nr:hypothetical protein AO843_02335 [Lysinibacillus sp. ZYM-1]